MYSYGPPHMAKQKQDDQLEITYSSYVRTQDVTLKTCRRRWMIGRSGERGSGISVLAARNDDDDDYMYCRGCKIVVMMTFRIIGQMMMIIKNLIVLISLFFVVNILFYDKKKQKFAAGRRLFLLVFLIWVAFEEKHWFKFMINTFYQKR